MNTVDKKTAFALKEAGFPQPEPAFGQVWYHTNEVPVVVVGVSYQGAFIFTAYYSKWKTQELVLSREALAEMAFAPNAADVLAEMPDGSKIEKLEGGIYSALSYIGDVYAFSFERKCVHEAMAARYLDM